MFIRRLTTVFVLALSFGLLCSAQSPQRGLIPPAIPSLESGSPLSTAAILGMIKWDSIYQASKKITDTLAYHAYRKYDAGLNEYRCYNIKDDVSITDYNGVVLRYDINLTDTERPIKSRYFDKVVWLQYCRDRLPALPESLHLSGKEPWETLHAYYTLLGVYGGDEYGWLCEYSTAPLPPTQRRAAIRLVREKRSDLLRMVLRSTSMEGRCYALDALIYLDHKTRELLNRVEKFVAAQLKQDSMHLSAKRLEEQNKWYSDERKMEETHLLTSADSSALFDLRNDPRPISICGTDGSYKIYPSTSAIVLSDSALAQIDSSYSLLYDYFPNDQ